jgi:type IV pilus assembly protein PilM
MKKIDLKIPFLKLKEQVSKKLKLNDKFTKERFSFGLDLGSSLVKLVRLKLTKDKVELCDLNLAGAQSDLAVVLKRILESPEIKAAKSPSIHRCGVNISVSGPSTIIRYVDFPKINDNELRQALEFEAPKHIPFVASEVNLDGHILKKDIADNKMLVLLAAAKKELIAQRLQLLEESGLSANIIDMDSLALINAFNFNYSQDEFVKTKTVALLNIGALMANLNILECGIPRLSRDIYIAGNNFTQRIIDVLEMDFKSAEELKLNPDKERLDKVVSAVESVLSNLANEIRTSFDYYESQGSSSVAKIYLSGGGGLFVGLKDMLVNLLGIAVDYWDPLRQIALAENINSEKLKMFSSQLGVVVGLALR